MTAAAPGRPVDLTRVSRDLADPKWRAPSLRDQAAFRPASGGSLSRRRFEPWGAFAIGAGSRQTWQRGDLVPGLAGDECQLVELADGRIADRRPTALGPPSLDLDKFRRRSCLGQTRARRKSYARLLRHRGATRIQWATRLAIGFSGPAPRGRRSNLVMRISRTRRDRSEERLIASGYAAYSDIAPPSGSTIWVLWERGAERGYQFITFTRFDRDWLRTARLSAPRTDACALRPQVEPSASNPDPQRARKNGIDGFTSTEGERPR